ncbi:MAG: hypothetical protein E6H06_14115 [Bacteroidetes bacterium]|nr:MAG: hypothetical protein E6H06_14115 [Bacteroidota bacterium]
MNLRFIIYVVTKGMSKMIKDPLFCFYLEKLSDNNTRIINESYYQPANLMVKNEWSDDEEKDEKNSGTNSFYH